MTTPAIPPDHRLLSDQLVQELTVLRDALVQLSLSLRDWQCDVDLLAQHSARQETEALLAPMRHGSARPERPGQA